MASRLTAEQNVIRLKPYFYIHVIDNNSNVTRVEVGPQTFTRQEHEKVVFGPEEMIKIPPRNYVIISDPIAKEKGKPITDAFGNVRLRHGDYEIRFEQAPFPLYPGESVSGKITPLQVVAPNSALRLRAVRDFSYIENEQEFNRQAGNEWLFEGPATYIPRVEIQVAEVIRATIIKENQALKLRARRATIDYKGNARRAGEEWLVRDRGAYLPLVDEEVVETVRCHVLTDKKAVHLRALRSFRDVYSKNRHAGEEWLVTLKDSDIHVPDVYEEIIGEVKITTLNNRQYCVVLDPVGKDGKPQLGARELRKGEVSFFLQPGERLEKGIQPVYVLGEEEALLLKARENFNYINKLYKPGERWMIFGPCDFVPPVEVEVIEKRRSIPLDENEGIYVRDIRTGKVIAICGRAYMLQPHEELWQKELPQVVEELLSKPGSERHGKAVNATIRDKTRVIVYRAPHNSVVQIYDFKTKHSRIVFGPELVMLGPDEHFTLLSLSGGKPKQPDQIRSLCLLLGPDFMTDVVIVETSDHARLALQLAYNWHFEIGRKNEDNTEAFKLFNVSDFVGDACKALASRIRGAVASATFDSFHRNSAELIRVAVFGNDSANPKAKLIFQANNMCITNVDIQSVEPVDQRTRDSLQKAVQLAIEITTKSQEAAARHEAERLEQEARGRLQRQRIEDESKAEQARKDLLQLQANSAVVEVTGQATAEARARCDAAEIEAKAAVKQSELRAQATKIRAEAELEQTKRRQSVELEHSKALIEIEIQKSREIAEIESKKFSEIVEAIGPETIASIASAGPEMQAKLLQGLGLKGFMITDGHSPVNLFQTAQGLVQLPSIQ
eukprot:TRINITY_DN33_c0_g1_i5.p1 TRINITY_DN33_c0_g1~~TRINITY_DN33_c0_g1_i5.p1  ORF type:complete len:840 (-),score=524.71 TRINITY_DN33_c0_g1_i5:245-2764(-)